MARPRALPLLLLACTLVCIIPVSLGLTVPLVASQQCYSSFAQLTNSQTIADVCAGLRAMGQACLVEMQQEAAAEEAAGIAGTISSYQQILGTCGISLPAPRPQQQTKPGCSQSDVENCYGLYGSQNAAGCYVDSPKCDALRAELSSKFEACMDRNDKRVDCCRSPSTTAC